MSLPSSKIIHLDIENRRIERTNSMLFVLSPPTATVLAELQWTQPAALILLQITVSSRYSRSFMDRYTIILPNRPFITSLDSPWLASRMSPYFKLGNS